MKIGTKIALQFTLIVAIILGIFSSSLFYLLESYTKKEFTKYLKDRAITTASLLIKEKNISKKLLKIIDKNSLSTLYAAQVLIFDKENNIAYANTEADSVYYNPEILEKIRSEKYVNVELNNKTVVGITYSSPEQNYEYLVYAQAEDINGKQKLENIKYAMTTGLITALLTTIIFSFIFSNQALKPISKLNLEISKISAQNKIKKLSTRNSKDEIAALAHNFNEMLSRLERSFQIQKSFVSNASHELRTPLAAIKSEIQVALEKERKPEEYQEILTMLEKDNARMVKLTNSLLQLAKTEEGDLNLKTENVRIDEILFEVQDELTHQMANYRISIDFETIPEDEDFLTINGNKALLATLFNNIIENACKYSENNTASVKLKFNKSNCIINIIDQGIGISKAEIDRVFEPFFRTKNAVNFNGHGLGLSICKKIVETHKGRILLKSEEGVGSVFSIILPHI